jgi:DNA invertase Pin-like site-specific DNA recombinase
MRTQPTEGCAKVYREKASGAQTNRAQLARVLAQLAKGDVLTVTRLDRQRARPATS